MDDRDTTEYGKAFAKIERLLKFADGNHNSEQEAANAISLAQRIADEFNIDIAGINTKADAREDDIFPGGLYPYQRSLYKAIADLNHCLYWSRKGIQRGEKYKHRIVGSKVNVALTKHMAQYLQQAVERLARERYNNDPKLYFAKEAHVYREGMVDRLVQRLKNQRDEEMAEAARRKREQAAAASHPGSTANALVLIDDVVEREKIANYDFQHGEGAWERRLQSQREYEERRLKQQQEYEAWALANPEEARLKKEAEQAEYDKWAADWRKREEARERRREKTGYYGRDNRTAKQKADDEKYSSRAYREGVSAGEKVSLNRQIDEENRPALR